MPAARTSRSGGRLPPAPRLTTGSRSRAAARAWPRARRRTCSGRRPAPRACRAAAGRPWRRCRRRAGTPPPRPPPRRTAGPRRRGGSRRTARPRRRSLGAREHAGARDADERAGVALREEVVRDRRVRLLLLDQVEVVVVDEPELDLAGRDGLDDRRVLLVRLRRRSAFRSTSHCCVFSSPAESRIAVTNAWNDAFVGAIPTLPFHAGSVRSKTESGTWPSVNASVL